MPNDDITLKTVLDHMQNMQRVLMVALHDLEDRLTGRVTGLEKRIDRLEINLTAQIEAIDKRLDAIEIENLPGRVKALKVAVGIH